MDLGWLDYVKLALPSSVISAVVTLVYGSVRDGRARKRDARHAALTAALSLERYARECRATMHWASDASDEASRRMEYSPIRNIRLAEFAYPELIEWKWLHHKTVSKLREFPALRDTTGRFVSGTLEYGDPIDYADEVEYQSAVLAKKALDLAAEVRAKHGVPKWEPGVIDASLETDLIKFIAEEDEKRQAFYDRQQTMVENMLTTAPAAE